MKRGTPRHRKMRALADRLSIPLHSAVGIMEMLWHYAGTETPEGDIGTATDEEIAGAVAWKKKPATLIEALVSAGWLDRDEKYRLVVHDWPDHAEQAVRKWLERKRKDFLPIYRTLSGHSSGNSPDARPPSREARLGLNGCSVVSEESNSNNGNSEQEQNEPDPDKPWPPEFYKLRFLFQDAFLKLLELDTKGVKHFNSCLAWCAKVKARRVGGWNLAQIMSAYETCANDQVWDERRFRTPLDTWISEERWIDSGGAK